MQRTQPSRDATVAKARYGSRHPLLEMMPWLLFEEEADGAFFDCRREALALA